MNYEGVCKTAPATPGLLKTVAVHFNGLKKRLPLHTLFFLFIFLNLFSMSYLFNGAFLI